MGNKKKANRKKSGSLSGGGTPPISEKSDSFEVQKCKHLKGVNDAQVRKKLAKIEKNDLSSCELCPNGEQNDSGVWFCLTCGHRGCGRSSNSKHSVKHFGVSRSTPHPIVIHYPSYSVWCYECDDDLQPSEYKKLEVSVNEMKKIMRFSSSSNENSSILSMKPLLENDLFAPPSGNENNVKKTTTATTTSTVAQNSCVAVKGLQNLGNTCFFNSVLQNLVHSHALLEAMKSGLPSKNTSINLILAPKMPDDEEPLPPLQLEIEDNSGDYLTGSLLNFINSYQIKKDRYVSPSSVLSEVCRKNNRFRGGRQQDSHELLRCLLDGLRSEELSRLQKAICTKLVGVPEPKNSAVSEQVAKNIKTYYAHAPECLVDRVFGGELLQTIRCNTCGHISQTLEHFLDISLPISSSLVNQKVKKKEGNDSDEDLEALLNKSKNVSGKKSKHQAKKQAKQAKKSAKKKSTLVSLESTQDTNSVEEPLGDPSITNGTSESSSSAEEITQNGVEEEVSDEDESGSEGDTIESDGELTGNYKTKQEISLKRLDRLERAPSDLESAKKCSLESCLNIFTTPDLLCGKNQFGCIGCAKKANNDENGAKKEKMVYSDAEKSYVFYSPPTILTIQLKRFQGTGYATRKLSKDVSFPLNLNLSPFCSKLCQRLLGPRVEYNLYGLVSHSGGLGGGHYVAYIRARDKDEARLKLFLAQNNNSRKCRDRLLSQQNEQTIKNTSFEKSAESECEGVCVSGNWFYISDTSVKQISQSDVLKAEAYILFYERIK